MRRYAVERTFLWAEWERVHVGTKEAMSVMHGPHAMRILIADHQAATRMALRVLLQEEPGLMVVGEAADRKELVTQVAATRPDALLLDWELAGTAKAELMAALRALNGQLRVIVLSVRPELENAAMVAGADAFVSKGDPPRRLLAMLQSLSRNPDA